MSDYINKKSEEIRTALIKKAKKGSSTYYSELMNEFHISRGYIGKILYCVAESSNAVVPDTKIPWCTITPNVTTYSTAHDVASNTDLRQKCMPNKLLEG